MTLADTGKIPKPFDVDDFEVLQNGVYDEESSVVYINHQRDFSFIHPVPEVDYFDYQPRFKKLNLGDYRKQLMVIERRLEKIKNYLKNCRSLLEIGAGNGAFLELVRKNYQSIELSSMDKDKSTEDRRKIFAAHDYDDFDSILKNEKKYDLVCLFHVLEHIISPEIFLGSLKKMMHQESLLIIEVPSLFDPLISIFRNQSYLKFYFQSQHPFVYSQGSLPRLLEMNGLRTIEVINYQRYGLENHFNWLTAGKPGGNDKFKDIFGELDGSYIEKLEKSGKTDTVICVGKLS